MIAGTGVSVGGAGMLRTRRRDISIKPNRKLDRKSSRGMIYENEELRLRTIHINAEVEQGQNDIKKLRRENEQLRREIWGLRDEYDKLEEILKQQKLKKNSDNSDTDYSEDEDSSNEEEEDTEKDVKKEEHLDNKENQKLSAEEMHRLKVEFDELSVVDEEELKEGKEGSKSLSCEQSHAHVMDKDLIQEALSFYSIPFEPASSKLYSSYSNPFASECPFIFPNPALNYPEKSPEGSMMIPPCPPMYANDVPPNLDLPRPVSTLDSHLGSIGFPSVSDLDNSSSEASVQTRSTKVASSSNLPKLNPITGDNAFSIPKGVQEEPAKTESSKKPKHFFAPLFIKSRPPSGQSSRLDEVPPRPNTICEKGSADICVNEDSHQPTFLSSENLFVNSETEKRHSGSTLVKSLSCHDLPKSDSSSAESKSKHAKSENALDSSGSFQTRVDINLKPPAAKPPSPTTPEVPKLPSFDSKLFSNQYHRHFEQYRNYLAQAMKKPVNVQAPNPPGFCPGFYGFIPIPKSAGAGKGVDNLEQYQALLLNGKVKSAKDIQVTSFETPSPRTVQVPPMTPYDLNLLYSKLPTLTPDGQGLDVYHNLPLLTKDGAVICPNGPGLKVQCEACLKKVPAQTQTSDGETERKKLRKQKSDASAGVPAHRRKERLRKQTSVTSSDIPETPVETGTKRPSLLDEKNESRSSSSGGESPRKDYRRMTTYFNPKKRPSVSSTRTSKSLSLDINKGKNYTGSDTVDSGTGSDKEKSQGTYGKGGKKGRKGSASSESVPWCACWGNGCI